MRKQNIHITGVAGFIGSHLADAFVADGHNVSGCDNLVGGYLDNVSSEVDFYEIDCIRLDVMNKLLKNVDIVYHTACTAYEGLSSFAPNFISLNTLANSVSVITAAINNRVRRFVYMSSMARYGTQDEVPFREDMIPKPQDVYGVSKLASEQILNVLSDLHEMESVIAVPHNVIGPRQKYDDPYRNVASIMINRMLQGNQPVIYGDGSQMRCFSFINDALDPLVKMGFEDNVVGEVINIGPDEEFVTINDLARKLADLLNFDLNPIYVPGRPLEVKFATCSADKARKLLGFETSYSLRQGLQEMIYYVRHRGTKPFDYSKIPIEIRSKLPVTWDKKLI